MCTCGHLSTVHSYCKWQCEWQDAESHCGCEVYEPDYDR